MTSKNINPTILALSPKHLAKNRETYSMLRNTSYILSILWKVVVSKSPISFRSYKRWSSGQSSNHRFPTIPPPSPPTSPSKCGLVGPNPEPSILSRSLPCPSCSSPASPFFKFPPSQTNNIHNEHVHTIILDRLSFSHPGLTNPSYKLEVVQLFPQWHIRSLKISLQLKSLKLTQK